MSTLKAMNESLQNELERVKRENTVINERRKKSRKKVAALEVLKLYILSFDEEYGLSVDS